jgi:hypothetical protein
MFKKWFRGYKCIGRLTIYGNNVMHWQVAFSTKKYGYICFRLPFRSMGAWWPLYFYCSPNAAPWAATYSFGKDRDAAVADIRKKVFGHNFDIYAFNEHYNRGNDDLLCEINKTGYEPKPLVIDPVNYGFRARTVIYDEMHDFLRKDFNIPNK